jgi:hypothetical protein
MIVRVHGRGEHDPSLTVGRKENVDAAFQSKQAMADEAAGRAFPGPRFPLCGDARERWNSYALELKRYAESSASDEEAKIASAKTRIIAATKDEVLDRLFGIRSLNLTHKTLEAGYDKQQAMLETGVEQDAPNTAWGIVQGLTRHSREITYADQRTAIDRAAGKILEIQF